MVLTSATRRLHDTNLPSASKHPEFITLAVLVACTKAKTFGPFLAKLFDVIEIFGVGVVPKTNQTINFWKLCLIHLLSTPLGCRVNDGISKEKFSLHYATIDNAFRLSSLKVRLRSSSAIFNSVADAVEWILEHQFLVQIFLHYLDNYLNVVNRSRSSSQCQFGIIFEVFRYLRIPIAEEKIEG